ncbi:MAG: superoxide dismutase [Candidatus Dojkabacteria bacterium]|nr:MAG: superoxide dismutase [Candidatus Dojkabacteria bacterium]
MKYELAPLPYAYDALAPVISEEIMKLHHDKHHAAYVNGANAALEKLEKARNGEVEIDIKAVLRDLSFNVNGHVLHQMFWENMRAPQENNVPTGAVKEALEKSFGSVESFQKQFGAAAKAVEGSGWALLVADTDKNLMMIQIEKQNFMHVAGFTPILGIDVWEHAYYLDYKNDRGAYVDAWWKLVNWDDIERRLAS